MNTGLPARGRTIECDVLVAGAGPAGGIAAREAARAGADTLMVDRRRIIGTPPRCAGFVPAQIMDHHRVSDAAIEQAVSMMETSLPDGSSARTSAPGYIVSRDLLDQEIAESAKDAGAKILTGCRLAPHRHGISGKLRNGDEIRIQARVVIGADGPRSAFGKWIGSVNRKFLVAAQWTLPLKKALECTRIHFFQELKGGYGWLFPRGMKANAGVGIIPQSGIKPLEALKYFIEKIDAQGHIRLQPLNISGGVIPVGEPLVCHKENIILAGDAAGLCHAQTGAGILAAIQSGEIAGKAAAACADTGETAHLAAYAREIDSLLGDTLRYAVDRRRMLLSAWDRSTEEFCREVRRTWVAYPGYRRPLSDASERKTTTV